MNLPARKSLPVCLSIVAKCWLIETFILSLVQTREKKLCQFCVKIYFRISKILSATYVDSHMIIIIFCWVRQYNMEAKMIILIRHIWYSSDDSNAQETFMKFSHSFFCNMLPHKRKFHSRKSNYLSRHPFDQIYNIT